MPWPARIAVIDPQAGGYARGGTHWLVMDNSKDDGRAPYRAVWPRRAGSA